MSDLKLLHLKVLSEFQLERESTLDAIKSVCRGNVEAGDESYYLKLAKVREVALRPVPGRGGTLYPPAIITFLIDDVLNRDGSVRYASQGLEIRRKQLAASIYCQRSQLRGEREKDKSEDLQRLLCNKQKKGDGARGAGAPDPDEPPPPIPPTPVVEQPSSPSDAELAAIYAARAKARESERGRGPTKGLLKLGKFAIERKARIAQDTRAGRWVSHDLGCLHNKDQYAAAGLLVGPIVRAAGNAFTGQRLLESADCTKLKDQQIMAEGEEVCIRSCSNDECPFKDDPSKCRYHHLDMSKHPPHGLPEQLRTAQSVAKLPKETRMFGVSLGGFKCESVVPVEHRAALIKKIRDSASGPVGASNLYPANVYHMVPENSLPLEAPLKELMEATGVAVSDLKIPPPVRAFDGEPVFSDDGPAVERSSSAAVDGETWRRKVLHGSDTAHAKHDIFVQWTARRMATYSTQHPHASDDDTFNAVMTDDKHRGSRVLSLLCAKYAPTTADERDLAGDHFCMASGLLLLSSSWLQSQCRSLRQSARCKSSSAAPSTWSNSSEASSKPSTPATWLWTRLVPSTTTSACVAATLSSTSCRKACSRTSRCGTHVELASLRVFATKRKWRLSGSGPSPGTCLWRSPSYEPAFEIC